MPASDKPIEVVYTGRRDEDGNVYVTYTTQFASGVVVEGDFSPIPSRGIRNHSPNGFEWGYNGSGPAQLALALCLDAFENDRDIAEPIYQRFKFAFVSGWPKSGWTIKRSEIIAWAKSLTPRPDSEV